MTLRYALAGSPTAVTSAVTVKSKGGFQITRGPSNQKICPSWSKSIQNSQKTSLSTLMGALVAVIPAINHSTAGLLFQYEHTKNQFPSKTKGLRKIRDHHWKTLGIFSCNHFLAFYFKKQANTWPRQKYTRQIWIRLVELFCVEVLGPSEVPRFGDKLIS